MEFDKKSLLKYLFRFLIILTFSGIIYLLTLFFPQPFFKYTQTVGNITIYSDQPFNEAKMSTILESVKGKIERSVLYDKNWKHRIFIANNPIRWTYFTNINYKVGGINYPFANSIFLRKSDIDDNRLFGPSGNKVSGDRTLDYFMAHEITHTLEYRSMIWYKYPIFTNWVLEGYCEYIAHDSRPYAEALSDYLNVSENKSAKYYTKERTLVTYLLEKEQVKIGDLWNKTKVYDEIYPKAIPDDKPKIE